MYWRSGVFYGNSTRWHINITPHGIFALILGKGSPLLKRLSTSLHNSQQDSVILKWKRTCIAGVCTTQNTDAIRAALKWSLSKSTLKSMSELVTFRHSIQQILQLDLHMYPYRRSILNQYCIRSITENGVYYHQLNVKKLYCTMCDFQMRDLDGAVNKQNVCFWNMENPSLPRKWITQWR
jgi:hypothetical protein